MAIDPHVVRTARGAYVNMMELRKKAKNPIIAVEKGKVDPQKMPAKQTSIQGFMPSLEGVATRTTTAEVKKDQPKVVYEGSPDGEEAPQTMADVTGVVIDKPRFLKEKPEDSFATVNGTLKDIMTDLEQYRNRKSAETKTTKKTKQT